MHFLGLSGMREESQIFQMHMNFGIFKLLGSFISLVGIIYFLSGILIKLNYSSLNFDPLNLWIIKIKNNFVKLFEYEQRVMYTKEIFNKK